MRSSELLDNKKKEILILGQGPTQVLDDTKLTAEKDYSINFTMPRKKLCLSLHYNGKNSNLIVNGTEFIKFKPKNSAIVATPLWLGNIWKYFSLDNIKKAVFYGYGYD